MRNNSSPNAQLYKEISTTCQAVAIEPCNQINVYPCQIGNSPSVERPVCPAARLPSQSNSPIVRDPIGRRLFIDVFFRSLLPEQDSAILPQLRVQTATSVFCFRLSATAALFNRCLQIHFSETSTSMKPPFILTFWFSDYLPSTIIEKTSEHSFTCFVYALSVGRPYSGVFGCAPSQPCRQHGIKTNVIPSVCGQCPAFLPNHRLPLEFPFF